MKYFVPIAYIILLILGIPWYWPAEDIRHIAGIPLWVLASLFACFLASCLTATLFLFEPSESEEVQND